MKPNLQVLAALRELTPEQRNELMSDTIDATMANMTPLEIIKLKSALGRLMNVRGIGDKKALEFVLTLAINDALPKNEVV